MGSQYLHFGGFGTHTSPNANCHNLGRRVLDNLLHHEITKEFSQMNKVKEKLGRAYLVSGVAATTVLLPIVSHADDGVTMPELDFGGSKFVIYMGIAIAFAVTAGLANLGLASIISVMRKARGAVR
jgi:hypothetical protein